MVEGDDAVVDLGAHHVVTHSRVDRIGKIDRGCTGGQVLHVAVGREHEHLVREHIDLQGVDIFFRVGALLVLQQAADPLIASLRSGTLAVLLVFPVGGHAVFRDLVHLPGPDLNLKGIAVVAHNGGVERLVAVGLGSADIVLEPAQYGLVNIVDNAQNVVAVAHVFHHYPEGEQVEDLVDGLVLVEHLPVDGIGVLHAAVYDVLDAQLVQPLVHLVPGALHEGLILGLLGVQLGDDLLIADGVQVFQRQVLQLPLDALHAQTVGDGRVDLHGLQGLLLLLGRGLVLHGPHVVEPVGDLDEDDPDVLAHGKEHLPQVLHLLVFLGGVLDTGQLADALHQVGDGGRKELRHILMGGGCILNDVVEQGGLDGLTVQLQFLRHDLGHGQGMDDIRLAALALLALVALVGIVKGGAYLVKVSGRVVAPYGLFQQFILLLDGHGWSPRFRLAASCSRTR